MTTSAVKFDDLRARILLLDATSDQGFEGLIGAVLSDQTGSAFDLAKSGSQRGKDGQSAYDTGAVRFECKLYTGPVPRTEALSKIGEIGADNNSNVELFVIASTSIVRTQDREAVEAIGAKLGIATFIVDWPSVGIPNLAVLLAMSPDVASIFIAQGLGCPASDVRVELDEVAADPHFADRARELRNAIDMPSASPAFARRRNASFLRSAFENSRKARTVFAQVLAPADPTTPGLMPRQGLKDKLGPLAFGPPIDTTVFILGGDGNGKSWIFAQSWLEQDDPPLTVIIMPEDFPGAVTPVGLQELLIGKLLTQTGDIDTLETRMRWRRFFQMWRQTKSTEKPRLVLFLDGINQRESLDWPRIIIGLSGLLAELGGRLIVSSRTAFFNARIKVKLLDPYEFVEVGQWSNPELQELLNPFNELVDSLEAAVANILRNPRIFAIAARLHRSGVIRDFRELSVSRLLLEHLRSGAAPEPMTEAEFIASLRSYADAIVQRLVNQQHDDLKIFSRPVRGLAEDRSISDQMAVIADGNFFEPVKGDSTLFRLKDESSPLALGLSVLSTAQRAQRNQLNISGALSKVLDPISAVDDMADVLLSALIAAVLLDDNAEEIVAALAVAYASLQNLDQTRFAEFKALVLRLPQPFLLALEDAVLSDGSVANLSWLVDSVMELRREPACRAAIETSPIHSWFL